MKIVVIGGTGHVGTYLIPGLVTAGHEVISVSRQKRKPYSDHAAWKDVKQVVIDRVEADKKKSFGKQISKLYGYMDSVSRFRQMKPSIANHSGIMGLRKQP
jgi:nucleoside-diphosphate-sugar epimerase